MGVRRRALWSTLVPAALIVGACGGDGKPSQAEIDAAVAKALETTTSTAASPAPTTTAALAPTTTTAGRPSTTTVAMSTLDPKCESWDTSKAGSPICMKWNYSPGYSNPQTCVWQADGTCKITGRTATTARPAPTAATTAPPRPPPTSTSSAPKAKTWMKVSTFSGSGNKNGPVFQLHGGQQRLSWSCSMPPSGYTGSSGFYVESTESSLYSEGSFNCNTEAGRISDSGETLLYMTRAGTYYFKVLATPNNTWTVAIEEQR
jgi:hypothetical protein